MERQDRIAYPNVAVPERIASAAAGAALLTRALYSGSRGLERAALALAGGVLLYRAATGRCPAYRALRTGTLQDVPTESPNALIPHGQGVKVEESVVIDRSADDLYRYWRDFSNLTRYMDHLEAVTVQDEAHSHWVTKGPFGKTMEWDAEIISEVPNRRIAWRSNPEAAIVHAGSVTFKPVHEGEATEVKVTFEYAPPAGLLGAALAKASHTEPGQQVADDLRRFKEVMETEEKSPPKRPRSKSVAADAAATV